MLGAYASSEPPIGESSPKLRASHGSLRHASRADGGRVYKLGEVECDGARLVRVERCEDAPVHISTLGFEAKSGR
eukprot:7845997-Pyramimonas_sp.AAC.1